MPIYEYTCKVCGRKQEAVQSYEEAPPLCCNAPMQRGFGSLAFYRMAGDRNGSTPGARKYAAELTRKHSRP